MWVSGLFSFCFLCSYTPKADIFQESYGSRDSCGIPTAWKSISLFIIWLGRDKKKGQRERQDGNHNNHRSVFICKYAVLIWINAISFILNMGWDGSHVFVNPVKWFLAKDLCVFNKEVPFSLTKRTAMLCNQSDCVSCPQHSCYLSDSSSLPQHSRNQSDCNCCP